jgi:hypothetical protein
MSLTPRERSQFRATFRRLIDDGSDLDGDGDDDGPTLPWGFHIRSHGHQHGAAGVRLAPTSDFSLRREIKQAGDLGTPFDTLPREPRGEAMRVRLGLSRKSVA